MKRFLASSSLFLVSAIASTTIFAYPIGGSTPSHRPDNAPVIKEFEKSTQWYEAALQGVEQPYPASFRFLEDQGAWYTPFTVPGMPGYYDIRNWHQK